MTKKKTKVSQTKPKSKKGKARKVAATKKRNISRDKWGRPTFKELLKLTKFTLMQNWKTVLAIGVIYGGLYFIFSEGISLLDISQAKLDLSEKFGINFETAGGQLALMGLIFKNANSLSQVGAAYVLFTTFVTTLALIWVFRHAWADKPTTFSEAYYKGMYPIVPMVLLFMLIGLQMLPFIIGSSLLNLAISAGIIHGVVEVVTALIVLVVLPAIWSFVMIIRTLMAMIIVTIPDMTPMAAYDSAKELIKGHRIYITKQILMLGIVLSLMVVTLLLIVIALVPVVSVILSVVINIIILPISLAFFFSLYRGLLDE